MYMIELINDVLDLAWFLFKMGIGITIIFVLITFIGAAISAAEYGKDQGMAERKRKSNDR